MSSKSKSRKKLARFIGLTARGLVRIVEGNSETFYTLENVPADFGTAYRIAKCDEAGVERTDPYHVHFDAEMGDTCDCLGSLRHGHCKHRDGLKALIAAGKLN